MGLDEPRDLSFGRRPGAIRPRKLPASPKGGLITPEQTKKHGIDYKWIVLVNTTIGMLVATIDSSIVTIALPDITQELHAGVAEMMWVMMSYFLLISSLLLPVARISDMFGRVRLYTLGFAIFTIGSALCGFAHSGLELVLFRLLQGSGAAMLYANIAALVTDAFPDEQRGLALGINMMVGISGFMLGSLLGGVITQYWGWRYIFFVNIPVGVIGTLWAHFKLREIGKLDKNVRIDWAGTLLFASGTASVLGGFTFVVVHQAGRLLTWILFGAGLLLLAGFIAVDLRIESPMMDLRLFKIREFWAGNSSLFLNALSRGSIMFVLSWYFQSVLQNSPVQAGLKLLPLVCAMIIVAPISGALSDRIGARWLATGGLAVTLAGQIWLALFPSGAPYSELAILLVVLGIGNSVFNSPNTSSVMGSVPAERRGVAAGMRTLCNNLGRTFALGIVMTCLSSAMSYHALAGIFSGVSNAAVDRTEFMKGFHEAFVVGSILTAAAVWASALRGSDSRAEKKPLAAASA